MRLQSWRKPSLQPRRLDLPEILQRLNVFTPAKTVPKLRISAPPSCGFHPLHDRFSPSEVARYERAVHENPADICARGMLIARINLAEHASDDFDRTDHLLWMIQYHPEWDGFLLPPRYALTRPRSSREKASYDRIKQAWLEQVGPQQTRGIVLHNAAVFFAERDPAFAAELLKRAIAAEPDVPFYVERLGAIYARAFAPESDTDAVAMAQHVIFRQQVQIALLSSNDWVLLAGFFAEGPSMPTDIEQMFRSRQSILTTARGVSVRTLPSYSGRFSGSECQGYFDTRR